jgi:hypothetical protein
LGSVFGPIVTGSNKIACLGSIKRLSLPAIGA